MYPCAHCPTPPPPLSLPFPPPHTPLPPPTHPSPLPPPCLPSLNEGGTLILELPHPRETFRLYDVTAEGWNVPEGDDNGLGIGLSGEEGGGFLEVTWGADEDEFDPVSQVRRGGF